MDASATENCPIEAGSAITLQWCHTGTNCSSPISQSHTGPIIAYMAPLESNGAGEVWFKIYEEGWDNTTKRWSTDKLIADAGKRDVIIPSDLKAGKYLLRSEIIALHDARVVGGAQFFPNCVQLTVAGSGNSVPTGVAIPGAYGERDPGILYSRSSKDNSGYVIPGPAVYVPGSRSSINNSTTGGTSSENQSSSEPPVQSSEPAPPSPSPSSTFSLVASPANPAPTSSARKCRPRPTSSKCMQGSGGVARRMAKRTALPSPPHSPEQQEQQQQRAEL